MKTQVFFVLEEHFANLSPLINNVRLTHLKKIMIFQCTKFTYSPSCEKHSEFSTLVEKHVGGESHQKGNMSLEKHVTVEINASGDPC